MKSPLLLFLLILTGFFSASGQKPQSEELTNAQHARNFIDRIAPKMEITKSQKDSLTTIFCQFMDDVEKYRAGNNAKIINYLMKARDEKVKSLLHDDAKFDKYLLAMADLQKQRETQQKQAQQQQQLGGQQSPQGPGRMQ